MYTSPNHESQPYRNARNPGPLSSAPRSAPFARPRPVPVPAPVRLRLEDAQPSEAVTSNRRPSAPPSVLPTTPTTFAGGWNSSSSHAPTHNHDGSNPNGWERGRARDASLGTRPGPARTAHGGAQFINRPRPQTTAGAWSTPSNGQEHTANGTVADKGKARQWGVAPSLARIASANPVPVPVPFNPRPKVWVSQLPPSVTEEELRTVFAPFGEIVKIVVNIKTNANYAFAHVTYSSTASAADAITSLNLQPFPSLNGIGPSRPIKVEYASPPRNLENDRAGAGTGGRALAVTTEPPSAQSSGEEESRLFRARDTPELSQSQGVKREVESPIKRLPLAPEEPSTRRKSSGSRSRSESVSSNNGDEDFRRSPSGRLRSRSPLPTSSSMSGTSRGDYPPFIDPPNLAFDSIDLEPTRLGALVTDISHANPETNTRQYSLSYHFSRSLVTYRSKEELAKLVNAQLHDQLPGQAQLLQHSLRVQVETRPEQQGGRDIEAETITFSIGLSKKALGELGRTEPWSREEEEQSRLRADEMKRTIRSRIEEAPRSGDDETARNAKGPEYIEPPSLTYQSMPLVPTRPGRLEPSDSATTYSLQYLYPLDLLSPDSSSSIQDFEARIRERVQASGMRLLSMTCDSAGDESEFSAEDGEGFVEVRVEYISVGMASFHARGTSWDSDEKLRIASRLDAMRRIAGEKRHGAANVARTSAEGPQPDGTVIQRIPLPSALKGAGPDQLKQQTMLRVEEVKKRSLEGKVVLSSSIDGDFITICYFVDDSTVPDSSGLGVGNGNGEVAASRRPILSQQDEAAMAEPEDVKPTIRADEAMDVDNSVPATSAAVVPPTVKFPLGILRNSRADSIETYQAATTFIDDYFTRFDSSRSSLEGLYTRNAFFSLKVDTKSPRRLTTPITLFSRVWFQSANKFASTPTAITNAIRRLPAGSHVRDTILFNARTIPEFHLKKRDRAPILLHLTGEFEEFPEKTIRRFERTFVLVPRVPEIGGKQGSSNFIIHSDQLLIGHKAGGEPTDLEVMDPPFEPNLDPSPPTRAPPVVASHVVIPRPLGSSVPGAPCLSPPPTHQQPPRSEARASNEGAPPASASTAAIQNRPSQTQRRQSDAAAYGASTRELADNSSPRAGPAPLPIVVSRRLLQAEVLELSDSDSAMSRHINSEPAAPAFDQAEESPSLSPEVLRPTRQLHPVNGSNDRTSLAAERNGERARRSDDASSDSFIPSSSNTNHRMAPSRPSPAPNDSQSRRLSNSLGKRKAVDPPEAAPVSASQPVAPESPVKASQAQFLPEELQRYIAEQVAKEVQEKLRNAAAATSFGGDHSGSEPAKKKRAKGKHKDDAQSKEKKKKTKDKKEVFPDGLGTGLSPGDSRIVIAGLGHSILHGFDGRSNKLRGMIQTADASSFLSVSFLGDIAEWSMQPLNSLTNSSITKLYSSNQDKFRVDDFTYNRAKDTLLVGYLGAKEGKEMACPPNQVVLYKRDVNGAATRLVETRLTDAPHVNGGVTAIMALPNKVSTGRLRFVTGGEDKKVYLWTRQRSTQAVKLEKFVTEHTSMITSFAFLEARNELVSVGKDRRVVTYDMERRSATWQTALSTAVMSVSSVLCDPNLILSRLATPSDQFLIHDRRVPATSPPVVTFGYDLPPHRSSNGTLQPTNMGRYPRGDQIDTVVVFPDHDQGVKMWDLRQVKTEIVKKQDLAGLGRSKVVQASFKGRNELCLMELAHFTRLSIKG